MWFGIKLSCCQLIYWDCRLSLTLWSAQECAQFKDDFESFYSENSHRCCDSVNLALAITKRGHCDSPN